MATTTIDIDSFQNALAECADAVASENRAAAYKWYARASIIHAGLEVQAGDGGSYLRRKENLDDVKRSMDAAFGVVGQSASTSRLVHARVRHQT